LRHGDGLERSPAWGSKSVLYGRCLCLLMLDILVLLM
jgi:hypothetical protein